MVFVNADCKILPSCWSFEAASSSMIAIRSLIKVVSSHKSSCTYFDEIPDSSSNVQMIISTKLFTSDFIQFFRSANLLNNIFSIYFLQPFPRPPGSYFLPTESNYQPVSFHREKNLLEFLASWVVMIGKLVWPDVFSASRKVCSLADKTIGCLRKQLETLAFKS